MTMFLLLLLTAAPHQAAEPLQLDPEALAAFERFDRAAAGARTLRFHLRKFERLAPGQELVIEESDIKFRRPDDYYIAASKPRVGQEVIYRGRIKPKQITVHPGRFPDMTLDIDMQGSLATKRQHHLVTHTAFGYMLSQLKADLQRAREQPTGLRLLSGGPTTLFKRAAKIIEIHAGTHRFAEVLARADESVLQFAERLGVAAYQIVYYNSDRGLERLSDELDARSYRVPRYYGERVELVLDDASGLPLRIRVWAFGGALYEQYEYHRVQVNVPLADADFDPENPAYNF